MQLYIQPSDESWHEQPLPLLHQPASVVAEEIMRRALHGKTRQSGEPQIAHCEAVVEEVKKVVGEKFLDVAVAAAWLHDLVEDDSRYEVYRSSDGEKQGKIALSVMLMRLGIKGAPDDLKTALGQVCYLVDRLTNDSPTYKQYIDGLFTIAPLRGAPSMRDKLNALAVIIKMGDRHHNTPVHEELNAEPFLREFTALCLKPSAASSEAQIKLRAMMKARDVLFISEDLERKPVRWYDSKHHLRYDEDAFLGALRQRFNIKIASNASDNLNFFLPKAEHDLLFASDARNEVFNPEKLESLLHSIYVRSLKALGRYGRGGIEDITYYRLKREQFEESQWIGRKIGRGHRRRRVSILEGIEKVYLAGQYGLAYADGRTVGKDDWEFPSGLPAKELRSLFVPHACYSQGPVVKSTPLVPKPLESDIFRTSWTPLHWNPSSEDLVHYTACLADMVDEGLMRESGESQKAHRLAVQNLASKIVRKPFRDLMKSVCSLHDLVEQLSPSFDIYMRRGKPKRRPPRWHQNNDWSKPVYLQNLLGVKSREDYVTPAGQLCHILDRISYRGKSYREYTDDLFDWPMDNPPPLDVLGGIVKICERYDRLRNFLEIREEDIIRQLGSAMNEARPGPGIPVRSREAQRKLYRFYETSELLFIQCDIDRKPISFYDEQNYLVYDEDLIKRAAVKLHSIRMAAMASDNIDFFLPHIEERALYTELEKVNGGPVFEYQALWNLVWDMYVLSFDALEMFGRRGIEDINYVMRKCVFRDRSEGIEDEYGYHPILSMMRRLYTAALNGLTDPRTGLPVEREAWRIPRSRMSVREALQLEGVQGDGKDIQVH